MTRLSYRQCHGRIPEKHAEDIVKMLTDLKSVAAPYKRPSSKKIAGDAAIYAIKNGGKAAARYFGVPI